MNINESNSESKPENSSKRKHHLKISLLECPHGGGSCNSQLEVINKRYDQSVYHVYEKNYLEAINALTHAYVEVVELNQDSCNACTSFFRSTIVESLKNIHQELQELTTGPLQNKRYKEIYSKADQILRGWEHAE